MTGEIPVLWPEDIRVDIVTPVAILRAQAVELSKRTHGLLRAQIDTYSPKDSREKHTFLIEAPYLRYSHALFTAEHDSSLVYPVYLELPTDRGDWKNAGLSGDSLVIAGEDELLKTLGIILSADSTRSLLHSLIARSRESDGGKGHFIPPPALRQSNKPKV